MTREQTAALATLIARGAAYAYDIGTEGATPEGLAEAALDYARACEWSSPTETAGYRQGAHEHVTCRVQLQAARTRIDTLELVLAAVLGAAARDGTSFRQGNLDHALDVAREVLGTDPH